MFPLQQMMNSWAGEYDSYADLIESHCALLPNIELHPMNMQLLDIN